MTASGSLPRAVISLSALRGSARVAAEAGGETADLRADAFGHGVRQTALAVRDAGIRRIVVEDPQLAASLAEDGVEVLTDAEPDIDSAMLYGLPGSGRRPAMTLTGRMLSHKPLRAGESVSYGYTFTAEHDTTIALVTGGYAQGIVRALGNHAQVAVGAQLRPIVGRVAMDVCVIDLQTTDAAGGLGGEVVYFGAGPAVDELQTWTQVTGLRATELVAVVGAKAVREWTD